MKKKIKWFIIIVFCIFLIFTTFYSKRLFDHSYDGLYLKNFIHTYEKGYAWMIDGDKLYIYSGGGVWDKIDNLKKNNPDEVEFSDGTFYKRIEFKIVLGYDLVRQDTMKMLFHSAKNDYSIKEIDEIFKTAYEKTIK